MIYLQNIDDAGSKWYNRIQYHIQESAMEKDITHSCIDCAVTGCNKGAGFPDFCLTTENAS